MNQANTDWRADAKRYLKGECSSEEAICWEELMLSNDEVLEVYMQVLSEMDSELPVMDSPEAFADRIMADEEIVPYRAQVVPNTSGKPHRWYENAWFHYTVAASITLVFMFSGAFDRLFPGDLELKANTSSAPSYSEQLMEHTTSWLDELMGR
ncbi:hypothetical protein [Paenibacillus dakarensis]|uniref:hypothetical protein n=1 Tax=Paenibacillus dakarensis TaxID=1527293 RepID=UPI0006D54D7B|nr:hypothetical protein [Paenibacillus dakarensis]